MRHKIYSIFDSKAEAFATPFFMPTLGMATRAFTEECSNPNSQLLKHPEDFTLFELGEYDDSIGLLVPHATPKSIGLAVEFANRGQAV